MDCRRLQESKESGCGLKMERTLIIIKPDAMNRTIVGEIIHRFERKGLKIIGMKMAHLTEKQLHEHYAHLKGKPFFPMLVEFMQETPTILMVLEGVGVVEICRNLCGATHGAKALPGTIRGDYSVSTQSNVVHASESPKFAEEEIKRFFSKEELFTYEKIDSEILYSESELE